MVALVESNSCFFEIGLRNFKRLRLISSVHLYSLRPLLHKRFDLYFLKIFFIFSKGT